MRSKKNEKGRKPAKCVIALLLALLLAAMPVCAAESEEGETLPAAENTEMSDQEADALAPAEGAQEAEIPEGQLTPADEEEQRTPEEDSVEEELSGDENADPAIPDAAQAGDTDPGIEEEIPVEEESDEALLADEWVTIQAWSYLDNDWGPVVFYEGYRYPATTNNLRKSGSNVGIVSIEWQKKNSSGDYVTDTSGTFTAGQWRCNLKLSGCSTSNIIVSTSSGQGRIRFAGFPEETWQGDGNSSGNITFHKTFTVNTPQEISTVNVEGSFDFPAPGKKAAVPSLTPDDEALAKGIEIADIYWAECPADIVENIPGWTNCKRMSSNAYFRLEMYFIVLRLNCKDLRYKLTTNTEISRNGGYFIDNYYTAMQPDGSLLIGNLYATSVAKDGFYYTISSPNKPEVRIDMYTDPGVFSKNMTFPRKLVYAGTSYTVTGADEFCKGKSIIQTVVIPSSFTVVGYKCFEDCSNLKTVTFEDGSLCTRFGWNAFKGCTALKEIALPAKLENIEHDAFNGCSNLESIYIPSSLTRIRASVFAGCPNIQDVYYNGTPAQWNAISIDSGNDDLRNAEIHFVTFISDCTASAANKTYNGKAQTSPPVVKIGGKTLKSGTDYTVTYSNNTNPGTAKAVIKGKGSYYGTAAAKYIICYTDVPSSHSYAKHVYWATEMGIAAGYTGTNAGKFGVNDNITRGQVVTFLWRAAGKPNPEKNTQTFSDVPTSHSFYKAIQWAVEKGITGGYTGARAGQFGPNDPCTRGQIAMFLWRYADKPEPSGTGQTFSDVPKTNNFYKAIQWASEKGITAGYSDGTFGINKSCTRGHCVTFLHRMIGD